MELRRSRLRFPHPKFALNWRFSKEVDAADAIVKRAPKKPKLAASAKKTAPRPLRGYTLKLLEHLLQKLNATDFVKISRSAVAREIGIAQGSIGASISKLIETGHLIEGLPGSFKLSAPKAH